jgi:hypothetical protein
MLKRVLQLALTLSVSAVAQITPVPPPHGCAASSDVGCGIPNLFGPGTSGITLPSGFHTAHFTDTQRFSAQFLPLNTAIATQLTLLPLPSPASGYTYNLDPTTGLRTPQAQTLGPILTERGETIGAKRFFVGAAYQRFRFNELDGEDLDRLPVVFAHSMDANQAYERDVITTENNINLKIDQFTFFSTVGVTDKFDVSVAVPVLDVRLSASSFATIQPLGGTLCPESAGGPLVAPCHVFRAGDPRSLTNTYNAPRGSASGLGDIILRGKYNLFDGSRAAVAVLTDLRLPSGNERNFLGSGAVGVKPFVAVSLKGRFAPHVNFGYQWNGESVLAGDITNNTKGDLPNQLFYSVGADVSIVPSLTIAVDMLGQRVYDAVRIQQVQHVSGFPNLTFVPNSNFGIHNGGVGFKYSIKDRLLLTANLLFAMDNGGLRQRVTPLIGLSYGF